MRKAYLILFGLVAAFLSTFVFRGLDANKSRPNTAQRLQNALYWATDKGLMYFRESPASGGQWPISGIEPYEFVFSETAGVDSTYTATLVVPAGYTVYDILFGNTVLWTAATSASFKCGDADDDDGYYTATNVKSTPGLVTNGNWAYNLHDDGGAFTDGKYYATAGLITAVITTDDDGTHADGRSRMLVLLTRGARTVTAATKAAV